MAIQKHLPDVSGFYLGEVLEHLQYGRLKIWIPGVYEDKYRDKKYCNELPEAVQVSPIFGGNDGGNGMFSYPNIGSIVVCFFINKDQNYPAYFGSLLNGANTGYEQWDQIFPPSKDPTTGKIVYGKEPAHIHKIKLGKTSMTFDERGSIEIAAGGSTITLAADGNINLKSTNITINAPSVQIIDANQIKMNSTNIIQTATSKCLMKGKSIELDARDGSVEIHSQYGNKPV